MRSTLKIDSLLTGLTGFGIIIDTQVWLTAAKGKGLEVSGNFTVLSVRGTSTRLASAIRMIPTHSLCRWFNFYFLLII